MTGSLHVGHALDHSIQDALVRRQRMRGVPTLWLPGMDHAGIATQNVVEREIAKEGLSRHDLGRDAFVKKVWDWKAEFGGKILGQMRRLGDSVDWSRERFTMDEGLSRAVLTIFKRLYDDDLIYRAERIINWCPRCLTALSDIEVEHSDDDGELVSIRYGYGDDAIVVATTRAETMLGDTAVAVHPDDPRYTHLVGREIELPLTGRHIPIVADAHVDPAFGTGAVKVTPAHDPNDFEIGRRHELPVLTIMDERGVITAHGPFQGLDRLEARPAVVDALREQGRIVAENARTSTPWVTAHAARRSSSRGSRSSGSSASSRWPAPPVTPYAMAACASFRPRWPRVTSSGSTTCTTGASAASSGGATASRSGTARTVRAMCVGPGEEAPEGWTQDTDVLDTWFSSALWPFSTLGWPEDTPELRAFYPTSVLVTGYDILFFWVARMMMFGLYAMDGVEPFKIIALHGMVRDQYGKKMSKSYGNVVDPLSWMDRYGTDATRFTLLRGANPGGDVAISDEWAQGSRNFCNKLWNATRFALLNGASLRELPVSPSVADRWILSRLSSVVAEVDTHFENFEFAKACETLYHFAWDEFCDWYVELSKVTGMSADAPAVLGYVLDILLRLLHPLTPFVTEELWTALTGQETIVVAPWPQAGDVPFADPAAEAEIAGLMRLVTEVRRFRADQGLKPGQKVAAVLEGIEPGHEAAVRTLLRLTEPEETFTPTAALPVDGVIVRLDTVGAIDVGAERARLAKDLMAARKEIAQAEGKLTNEQFMSKAPAHVVAKTRARLAQARTDAESLETRLAALPVA